MTEFADKPVNSVSVHICTFSAR